MRKKYKNNNELQQIVNQQKNDIELLENKVINKEFIIDCIQKENDQYVLTCKFLTNTLLMLCQLEKILAKSNNVFALSLQKAIASFKLEVSKTMHTIEYDGGDSYTFDSYINDNNSIIDD